MRKKITNALMICGISAMMLLGACKSSGDKSMSYTISGHVPSNVNAEWIYLYSINGGEFTAFDSARIEKGAFKLKGQAPDTLAFVALHPGSIDEYPAVGWNLILEAGDIVIDSANEYATGTPLNDGYKEWSSEIINLMMTSESIEPVRDFLRNNWSEHSSDFVGSFCLYQMSPYLDFPFIDSLASTVPEEVKGISLLKPFFEQLESVRKMQPGNMFTDLQLKYIDGTPVALSDIIGKGDWVLVDFWASWCGPCRQAMPELQTVVKKFKKLKVYGIAVRDEEEDTRRAIKDLKISWPVISDSSATAAQTYGIQAIPAMILFAPDGKIAVRDIKGSELESILSENMNK